MPNQEYERLLDIGSFGLEEGFEAEIVSHKMGARRRRDYLVGARSGNRFWNFIYKTLPQTRRGQIQLPDGRMVSRADYLWDFFCRHKTGFAEINRPFIVTNPGDGKDYLAVFSDHSMTRQLFMARLYSSQLKCEQVSVDGVNELEDGSLGEAGNNAEI